MKALSNDPLEVLVQDDTILAVQWADLHRSHNLSPEQRLCLAVLKDGMLNLVRPSGLPMARVMRQQDARQWVMGATDCYITFEFVCDALGIADAGGFGERLLRCVEQYLKRGGKNTGHKVVHVSGVLA